LTVGFLRRRRQRLEDVLGSPEVAAEIQKIARVSAATSADELPNDEERAFWRSIEDVAKACERAVDELVPQANGCSPEAARAGCLKSNPGQFAVANLFEHRVWKRDMEQLADDDFRTEAGKIESLKTTSPYHSTKVAFLAEERRRRGLPAGEVREPGAAADLGLLQAVPNAEALASERAALRYDIQMNLIEDALASRR
jgi:hypothetical protein